MPTDPRRLTTRDRANLVAYLDGELDQAQSHAIESRVAANALARRELHALDQTWGLLDLLPRTESTSQLVSRTLSEARPILEHHRSFSRSRVRALATLVLAVVGFGLGAITTRWFWSDPSERLARDLSVVEHLDAYRALGSIDDLGRLEPFLRGDEP